jgi:galactoside O-acetyltransferase
LARTNYLADEVIIWLNAFVGGIPGRLGMLARGAWLRHWAGALGNSPHIEVNVTFVGMRSIRIGDRFSIDRYASLQARAGKLEIGNRVSINMGVIIDACDGGEITIGNDVMVGPNVTIRASNHSFARPDLPIREQGHEAGTIIIGDDVWIAAGVIIVPGVNIGAHSVIGAGAVVTRDVAEWTVAGGVPAVEIAHRQRPT